MVGALAGALLGGAIGHYAYDQKKSAEETQQTYNYKPTNGSVLSIEQVSSVPKNVHPGQTVDLKMTYAILNPSPNTQTNIKESRVIKHNGSVVGRPEISVTRSDGTYISSVPLHLPTNAARGTYIVTSEIHGGKASDSREFSFTVN